MNTSDNSFVNNNDVKSKHLADLTKALKSDILQHSINGNLDQLFEDLRKELPDEIEIRNNLWFPDDYQEWLEEVLMELIPLCFITFIIQLDGRDPNLFTHMEKIKKHFRVYEFECKDDMLYLYLSIRELVEIKTSKQILRYSRPFCRKVISKLKDVPYKSLVLELSYSD